jgi:trk system potassium uptake protein TrkA
MRGDGRRICIVGLGHFGGSLARTLARHCDVLALDNEIARINAVAEHVQRALALDARDFAALSSVVSSDFDEAVVSIGESLEASILCTLHLKRIGLPVIRAKADSDDHAKILRSVGADHVIFPERETAERLALQMLNPNLLDFIPLARDYRVMDVAAPAAFHGRSLASLQIRNRFGLFVIAIKRQGGSTFAFLPGPEQVVEPADVLVTIGTESDILRMREAPAGRGADGGGGDSDPVAASVGPTGRGEADRSRPTGPEEPTRPVPATSGEPKALEGVEEGHRRGFLGRLFGRRR